MKFFGQPLLHLAWRRSEITFTISLTTNQLVMEAIGRRCPVFRSVKAALAQGLPWRLP